MHDATIFHIVVLCTRRRRPTPIRRSTNPTNRLGEIAGLRGVDQSVVSRQVGELQARGLVCRRPDPADRRAGLVRLTPEGRALLAGAQRLKRDLVRGALARAAPVDVRTAARVVAAIADELDDRLGDPDPLAFPRTSTTKELLP
ncbi:MarR family winged helix-turn-helix transcriptional regulator [Pseudonocardia sp.]|uniref:MarR family winged helix-turn-helix transcriptional regulator n=1 Tax=Pseudonocardia sp. TaxID=60912 RepID=UPI002613B696|nr:MarR family winged helix-turn-helix transcriptional regulator [Pseudonocardia sp.]